VLEHALIFCDAEDIEPHHLPPSMLRASQLTPAPAERPAFATLVDRVAEFEREIILNALIQNDWNKTRTAAALGITRRILSDKIQTLNVGNSAPDNE
jgi:two-component system, NtrC family, response regulator AtoC